MAHYYWYSGDNLTSSWCDMFDATHYSNWYTSAAHSTRTTTLPTDGDYIHFLGNAPALCIFAQTLTVVAAVGGANPDPSGTYTFAGVHNMRPYYSKGTDWYCFNYIGPTVGIGQAQYRIVNELNDSSTNYFWTNAVDTPLGSYTRKNGGAWTGGCVVTGTNLQLSGLEINTSLDSVTQKVFYGMDLVNGPLAVSYGKFTGTATTTTCAFGTKGFLGGVSGKPNKITTTGTVNFTSDSYSDTGDITADTVNFLDASECGNGTITANYITFNSTGAYFSPTSVSGIVDITGTDTCQLKDGVTWTADSFSFRGGVKTKYNLILHGNCFFYDRSSNYSVITGDVEFYDGAYCGNNVYGDVDFYDASIMSANIGEAGGTVIHNFHFYDCSRASYGTVCGNLYLHEGSAFVGTVRKLDNGKGGEIYTYDMSYCSPQDYDITEVSKSYPLKNYTRIGPFPVTATSVGPYPKEFI